MTKQEWTDVCIAFCERIKQAGYTPMIYGNLKTFMLMLDMEQLDNMKSGLLITTLRCIFRMSSVSGSILRQEVRVALRGM